MFVSADLVKGVEKGEGAMVTKLDNISYLCLLRFRYY